MKLFRNIPVIKPAADARRGGAGLPHARPARDDAVGWRGPASQALAVSCEGRARGQHPVHAGRADDGPAPRGHPEAAGRAAPAGRPGHTVIVIEHNLEVITTGRLDHRPGSRGRPRGRARVARTPEEVAAGATLRTPAGSWRRCSAPCRSNRAGRVAARHGVDRSGARHLARIAPAHAQALRPKLLPLAFVLAIGAAACAEPPTPSVDHRVRARVPAPRSPTPSTTPASTRPS